jgi:cytochrome c
MENKVGDKQFSPQKVTQLVKQLKDIVEQLRPYGITLTTDERKRTLRPRKGAEVHMQRVHQLASKHGVTLKNIPLQGMADDLALAKQFVSFEDELRAGLQLAEDSGTQADSEAWEAFLAYYGVLSSMAERSPELAVELESVVSFMATGPRKKPAPAASAK